MNVSRWQILAAALVVLLGGIAYAVFGAATEVNRADMSRLTVQTLHLPSFQAKPYVNKAPSISSIPSAILTEESARDPAMTGAYAVGWKTTQGSGNADLLIELLPTASSAKQARSALQRQYQTKKDYAAAGLTRVGSLSIPQIPGAFAAEYSEAAQSKSTPPVSVGVVVFQVHRVAVFLQILGVSRTDLGADVSSLAVSEQRVLDQRESGFSMSRSVYQASRGLWIGIGVLVGLLIVALAPATMRSVRSRRERRLRKAEQARHRHVTTRGSSVLRRGRVPTARVPRPISRFSRRRLRSRR